MKTHYVDIVFVKMQAYPLDFKFAEFLSNESLDM